MPGARRVRGRGGVWKWVARLAGLAIVVVVAAGVDFEALAQHAASGPKAFAASTCANPGAGALTAKAIPSLATGVGLPSWQTLEGSTTHDAVVPGTLPGGAALSADWTFATHGSVVTSPAVVGGVAYLGSMDGCVYALNVQTGRLLWSFASNNQVMSEPIVVDGRVFFGSGNKEMLRTASGARIRGTGTNAIYALDARTGQLLWSTPTGGENMPTLAYSHGVVYEASGDKDFYAVAASDGRLLWKLDVGSYVSMSSPAISGDIAVFGAADPYQEIGVNLQTHRIAWTVPLPLAESGVDDGSPAVAHGVAYIQVPEGHWVKRVVEMAIRTSDGQVLWQRTLGTDALNAAQRALWQGDMNAHDGEEIGIATVAGGRVYVGSPGLRGLWVLDAQTGAVISRLAVPADIRAAPAVTADRIYAVSDTTLYILNRVTGALLHQQRLGSWATRSGIMIPCTTPGPEVVGHTLLVGVGLDTQSIRAMPLGAW